MTDPDAFRALFGHFHAYLSEYSDIIFFFLPHVKVSFCVSVFLPLKKISGRNVNLHKKSLGPIII